MRTFNKSIKASFNWLKNRLYPKKPQNVLYAKYKDRYFYAKDLGNSVMLWRPSRFFDWDVIMYPDGSKIYRKRVPYTDIDVLFYAEFWIELNGVCCKAELSKNKKFVTIHMNVENENLMQIYKFKFNQRLQCWTLKLPVEDCSKYLMKIRYLKHGRYREKIKKMSMEYWVEMYERLNWIIEEPISNCLSEFLQQNGDKRNDSKV